MVRTFICKTITESVPKLIQSKSDLVFPVSGIFKLYLVDFSYVSETDGDISSMSRSQLPAGRAWISWVLATRSAVLHSPLPTHAFSPQLLPQGIWAEKSKPQKHIWGHSSSLAFDFSLVGMFLVLTYEGTVELERLGTTFGANQKD